MNRKNVTLDMRTRWERVPLDRQGDPHFRSLEVARALFSDNELVILVNRALYQMKYLKEAFEARYERKTKRRTLTTTPTTTTKEDEIHGDTHKDEREN